MSCLVKLQLLFYIYYNVFGWINIQPNVNAFRIMMCFTIATGAWIVRNVDYIMIDVTMLLQAIKEIQQ